jgi:acetolactate decarboxylase
MREMKVLSLSLMLFWSTLACVHAQENDVLMQVSTIDALLSGIYDGEMTIGELRTHGDVGLGTFNALDGEMVAVDGGFYQIKSDGTVTKVEDSFKTPFAAVTFFEADNEFNLEAETDFDAFRQRMDREIPTPNRFYAVRLEGIFESVKTRSVSRQERPYRPLVEVVAEQAEFGFKNVRGVMVGFRCPSFVKGLNVPGYHLHFLTKDGKAGGHVLDFHTSRARVAIDSTADFLMMLPQDTAFSAADFSTDKQHALGKVEK